MDARMLSYTPDMSNKLQAGLGSLFSGIFGHSDKPYSEAGKEYEKYFGKAQDVQNPFYKAGTAAIPGFQEFLSRMKDPSAFINNLMSGYQESPFAKFQQQQGIRAAQNLGSASGLTGSTPLQMQAQQNAQNISSGDMNQWLQNVLGVNSQYGGGLQNLISGGQNSANVISQLLSSLGEAKGGLKYGEERGKNIDTGNIFSGLLHLLF